MKVKLTKSDNKNKKYKVILYDNNNKKIKTIHFGASGHGDYIYYNQTKGLKFANEKKGQYIARHRKRENWNDPKTAGFWARWILWNKPTLNGSKNDIKKNKNISFI